MGRLFVEWLEGKVYRCRSCKAHLAQADELVSKARLLITLLLWPCRRRVPPALAALRRHARCCPQQRPHKPRLALPAISSTRLHRVGRGPLSGGLLMAPRGSLAELPLPPWQGVFVQYRRKRGPGPEGGQARLLQLPVPAEADTVRGAVALVTRTAARLAQRTAVRSSCVGETGDGLLDEMQLAACWQRCRAAIFWPYRMSTRMLPFAVTPRPQWVVPSLLVPNMMDLCPCSRCRVLQGAAPNFPQLYTTLAATKACAYFLQA